MSGRYVEIHGILTERSVCKEELTGHLDERVKSLTKKGMDEKSAVEKALGELGDISRVADEISKNKKTYA